MPNADAELLVVEFKKEVARMREREASDLEIQAMLEFVEVYRALAPKALPSARSSVGDF